MRVSKKTVLKSFSFGTLVLCMSYIGYLWTSYGVFELRVKDCSIL